jgi:hypothetical protein
MKIGFVIMIIMALILLAAIGAVAWYKIEGGSAAAPRYMVTLTGGPSTTAAQMITALQVTGTPPMMFSVVGSAAAPKIVGRMGSGSLVINNVNGALTGGTLSVTDTSVTPAGVSSTVLGAAQNYPITLA